MDDDELDEFIRKRRGDYPARPKTSREDVEASCADLISRLLDLEEQTSPSAAGDHCPGKDRAAFMALEEASLLVWKLAGWAIAHQAGRALAGKGYVPPGPSGVRNLPEFQEEQTDADCHKFERIACQDLGSERQKGHALRQFLLNLSPLFSEQGGCPHPHEMHRQIHEALDAAKHGEVHPFFDIPASGFGDRGYTRHRLQLKALQHVEYRKARGLKALKAQEIVSDQYGCDSETLRKWQSRMREIFGYLKVSRHLARAMNAGLNAEHGRKVGDRWYTDSGEEEFGDDVLARDGKSYIDTR